MPKKIRNKEFDNKLKKLYESGMASFRIAEELNVSGSLISKALTELYPSKSKEHPINYKVKTKQAHMPSHMP